MSIVGEKYARSETPYIHVYTFKGWDQWRKRTRALRNTRLAFCRAVSAFIKESLAPSLSSASSSFSSSPLLIRSSRLVSHLHLFSSLPPFRPPPPLLLNEYRRSAFSFYLRAVRRRPSLFFSSFIIFFFCLSCFECGKSNDYIENFYALRYWRRTFGILIILFNWFTLSSTDIKIL